MSDRMAGHDEGCPADRHSATGNSPSLAVLFDLTRAIISSTDLDELLHRIADETMRIFAARGCVIRLLEHDRLTVKACTGICDAVIPTLALGEGLSGRAALEDRTIVYRDGQDNQDLQPLAQGIQTGLCTPLKIGPTLIGTFSIYDRTAVDNTVEPFIEADSATFEGFASVAALIIEKSLLLDKALTQERATDAARREVEELKDYLQGFIENSPDGMATTDLHGVVTSWNQGSEKMFGYRREEALGRLLPNLPHFLVESEQTLMDRVLQGETIKDIETVRRTRDGRLIDVNLTIAPIKDASGRLIGVSRIARDITEKKRIEKDLLRKNTELSRLLFISSTMRGTLEVDRLLRMVLTAVTMGDGLGFNRAMLFLVDDEARVIRGAMGVGPATHDEAWEIWSRLSMESKDINTIMHEIERGPLRKDSLMDRLCCGVIVPFDSDTILTRAVSEKQPFNVTDVRAEPLSDAVLIQQLGTMAYAVVPLIVRDKVIGVLWVDNLYTRKPITDHDIEILKGFTDQIAAAIENARLFEEVARTEQELENIFDSISDLLYINGSDYTIKKINRAVIDRIGKPAGQIIGRKCYEVFHGMNEPWELCPHHKTVATKQSFVGEVDDRHLGGTFLISSSPLFDKAGDLLGTVHIARDVSEIKKLKEKVVTVERMAVLGEMAAKVAHEIRNPLLSIGGFARRLERQLGGDQRDNAKIIADEVRRLEGILNNTLSYVRSSPFEHQDVDAAGLLRDIVQLLEPVVNERGNTLTLELQDNIRLTANHERLREAVINLIGNANYATENGAIAIRCHVATSLREHDLLGHQAEVREMIIEIQDTGYGIREEDRHRIFDPFFTTRATGTGLGLSITKRIIEEHGGSIDVESAMGSGTLFRIHLPL